MKGYLLLIPRIAIFIITNEFMSKYLILSFQLVGSTSGGFLKEEGFRTDPRQSEDKSQNDT